MTIPSETVGLHGAFAKVTFALSSAVATKQFELDQSETRVKLETGVSGLKRRKFFIRALGHRFVAQPPVYIGDSSVTTSDGFPLYWLDELEVDLDHSVDVYAVATLSEDESAFVSIMEIE